MASHVFLLTTLCVLITASPVSASCRWFGTQLECDLGVNRVIVGTQASQPQTRPRHGATGAVDDGIARRLPLALELQNLDVDPSLCRTVENETDCY